MTWGKFFYSNEPPPHDTRRYPDDAWLGDFISIDLSSIRIAQGHRMAREFEWLVKTPEIRIAVNDEGSLLIYWRVP